jgi:[acyl-carrier-protein] S-malonyltransferase
VTAGGIVSFSALPKVPSERLVNTDKILFQFPGQGSQYRGMGSDLVAEFPVARDVYDRASEVLGYDLKKLSFEDPDNQLDLTRYTQPALLTHQVACLTVFASLAKGVKPMVAAGHSLGEYTALVAAGSLSLEDGVTLVAERGRLMSELGRGSMLATTLELDAAKELADKYFCGIGGSNLPEQTVIAGTDEDLRLLVEDLTANQPRKRAIELKTEGAFHSYLMIPAAEQFRPVLEQCDFQPLQCPVLSNYTGALHVDDAGAIRSRLFFQLFNPVRWIGCMEWVVGEGVAAIIEFGGGIGKGDGPHDKRPNLESVAKKSLKSFGHEAEYLAAINAASIRSAAEKLTDQ